MSRLLLVVVLASWAATPLEAQLATFDRLYAAAQVAEAAERQRAAAAASDAFLKLPLGLPGRRARLAAGIAATLWADRAAVALELVGSLQPVDLQNDDVVTWQLIALAHGGRLAEFERARQSAVARGLHGPAMTALRGVEGRLLPLADRALRRGEFGLGRAVFEALAAIEPPHAVRYANLGLCLRNLGELAAAEKAYERAVALAPEDAQIENDRGLLLRASGRAAAAHRAFRRSYELDGDRPGQGPAVTNLLHAAALGASESPPAQADPLPFAEAALAVRPTGAMLRRLVLDVALDRLTAAARR